MTQHEKPIDPLDEPDESRRQFLKNAGLAGTAVGMSVAASAPAGAAWGGSTLMDAMGSMFQDHYQRMSSDEIQAALARIERKAKRKHGVDIVCEDTPPLPDTVFGYALNVSKCQGYRDCV